MGSGLSTPRGRSRSRSAATTAARISGAWRSPPPHYQLVIIGDGQYRISWQPTPGDQQRTLSLTAPNAGHVSAATRQHLSFTVNPGQQWTFTPTAGCSQVPGFIWQILEADGDSDGRGIYDGCQPIGPLALTPGAYDVQIDAQSTDADYQFTARSS